MTTNLLAVFRHYQPDNLVICEGYHPALLRAAEGQAGVCFLEARCLLEGLVPGYRALSREADLVRWDTDVELGLLEPGRPFETVVWPAGVWYPMQAGIWRQTHVRVPEGSRGELCFVPTGLREAMLEITALSILLNPLAYRRGASAVA